jgi:hypothetical protein
LSSEKVDERVWVKKKKKKQDREKDERGTERKVKVGGAWPRKCTPRSCMSLAATLPSSRPL